MQQSPTFVHSESSDCKLVAALGAMGIPCNQGTMAVAKTRIWHLGEVSNCGKWKLKDLSSWWRDKYFHNTCGDHIFNRLKCAMASRAALLYAVKNNYGVEVNRRGNAYVASYYDEPNLVQMNPKFHHTSDISEVSAFLAMGYGVSEFRAASSGRWFQIEPHGDLALFQALKVGWLDVNFHKLNPEHPFAYVKAAIWNYHYLVDAIRKDKPLVDISREDTIAYLHPDCSAETERKIFSQFDK